jgi:hypothetical protein
MEFPVKGFFLQIAHVLIVPKPFNFCEAEIGAIPTTIDVKQFKVGIGGPL